MSTEYMTLSKVIERGEKGRTMPFLFLAVWVISAGAELDESLVLLPLPVIQDWNKLI